MLLDCRTLLPIVVSGAVLSCGGSSSETPPPLEPHPLNLHYSRAATTLGEPEPVATATATGQVPRDVPEDEVDEPVINAPRTWGGERAAPPPKLK